MTIDEALAALQQAKENIGGDKEFWLHLTNTDYDDYAVDNITYDDGGATAHVEHEDVIDDENEAKDEGGSDLCDLCYTSGVNVERTTWCGKTIGIECGCEEDNEGGYCNNEDCEACNKAKVRDGENADDEGGSEDEV